MGARSTSEYARVATWPTAKVPSAQADILALAKDPALSSRQYMALTILAGRRNMPAFGAGHAIGFQGPPVVLDAAQIAAVINYVRTHFDNHYKDGITAAEVAALDRTIH